MKPKLLRPMVLTVLRDFPKARDSDTWLTLKLWTIFYPQLIKSETFIAKDLNGEQVQVTDKSVRLLDIMSLPREDNIKRLRAKIQNEELKFLPTTWEVAKQRRIEESVWRNYVNYN